MQANAKTFIARKRLRQKHRAVPHQALRPAIDAEISRAIGLLGSGKVKEALGCLRNVKAESETSAVRCNLVGLIYLSARQNLPALNWFDRAVSLDPADPEAYSNRGMALMELGQTAAALASYGEAVRTGCAKPALFYNRGNLLREMGRLEEAIASYDMALKLDPAYPEALRAGGTLLAEQGYFESALKFLDEALRLRPDYLEAALDRGNILQGLGQSRAAIASYDAAIETHKGNPDLYNNRGVALHLSGELARALKDFDAAIVLRREFPQAWFNRGNVLIRLDRPEAALASFEAALALRPDYGEALCSRAVALKYLGRMDEALRAFDLALHHNGQSAHAKNNKAALLLLLGDFERGLDAYEFRWIAGQTPKSELKLPIPEWSGTIRHGEKIIVFDEQGLGDAIQFSRYLPLLADAGAEVTFFCRKKLHRLLAGLPRSIRLVDDIPDDQQFAAQIALSSLPRAFKTRLESIPARTSYLRAEASLVNKWAARIGQQGVRVGLCWHGSPDFKADPNRSIPLSAFAPLAAVDGVRLLSIQKVHGLGELEGRGADFKIERLGEDFDAGPDAFVDTAAVMQNLDLIITCDTSIAHLAGALGRPVFVLLKQIPDWRWLLERSDCPWYPSMRLFRQKQRGDWTGVVAQVAEVLRNFQKTSAAELPQPQHSAWAVGAYDVIDVHVFRQPPPTSQRIVDHAGLIADVQPRGAQRLGEFLRCDELVPAMGSARHPAQHIFGADNCKSKALQGTVERGGD